MANENVKEHNMEIALQTAFALFLKNGIEQTTKEMVVRESGLSRSSIDRYFSSKITCVLSVAKWAGQNIRDKLLPLQSILSDLSMSGADALRKYMQAISELLYKDPRLFVLGLECRTYVYRCALQSEETQDTLYHSLGSSALISAILKRGISDGSLHADIDATVEAFIIRESLLGFLASIALSYDREIAADRSVVEHYINRLLTQYTTKL